jgi:aconitase B
MGLSDSTEEQNRTEIEYLKRDNKALCESLTTREFQIISLCGIVGVDVEEHLEDAVKNLKADNKRLKAMYDAAKGDLECVLRGRDELDALIDELQAENEDLHKEYQDLVKINLELNKLFERWEHMIDPNTDPGGCANCFHQEWIKINEA